MFVFRKVIRSIWHPGKHSLLMRKQISASAFRKSFVTGYVCQKRAGDSNRNNKSDVPSPLSSKFELFDESTAPIILDVEMERQKIVPKGDVRGIFEGINLKRGVTGVFEINEVVDLLRNEKAQDIFVVKLPSEYAYADYMVIVTGQSSRHLLAVTQFIRKVYKMKMYKKDNLPKLESKASKNWMTLDLGNIILHVFSKEVRETYDLESLWVLGKEYDSLSQNKTVSSSKIMTDYTKLLSDLTPHIPKK